MNCCFLYHPTKPQMIVNKSCEGNDCVNVAFSSCMTSLQGMVPSARSVGYGSNAAVTLLYLVPWPSSPTYSENTRLETLLFTPLNWISIDVADSYLHPLLFLRSLEHCVRLSIMLILGFITPNLLPICVTIMLALAIFQAWIEMEVSTGNFLTCIQIIHVVRVCILVWMYCHEEEL